jgi:ATP-dependent exoDNAse (exonuclease V) alpha subunit
MAIFSCSMGFISRSEGRSSVGFGAYISGSMGHDQRTGVSYDYSNKKEVISARILAPQGAPAWALSSHTLWNNVERYEDHWAVLRFRGDSLDEKKNQRSLDAREKFLSSTQTAQTIMCALPLELTKEQVEACVEEFLEGRFVSRGLVTAYAIHWEKGNPHFHAQICRRALVDGEFSPRKDQVIVTKRELMHTRKSWEVVANKHLELAGHEVRIDCRSKEDQGSLFLATHHEGWNAQHLAERGEYSRIVVDNEEIRQQNIQIMCERPETLIHEVALKRTTFTRKHIEDEIIRRVGGDERLYGILKAKVEGLEVQSEHILKLTSSDIVYEGYSSDVQGLAAKLTDKLLADRNVSHEVGQNLNRQTIYTSTLYKQHEEALLKMTNSLNQRATKLIPAEKIDAGIANLQGWISREKCTEFRFSEEQTKAIHHLCSGRDIRVLNGKAGTGKTTLLKAVAQIYANEGYNVIGTTFQGKAVEIMEQEIGIPCRTMDSYINSWAKFEEKKAAVESGRMWGSPYIHAFSRMKELEKNRFTSKDVILVDEANMIGGALWEPFLKEAASQGAKVLIIQDPAQIKSRDPGDFGRLFAERYSCAETSNVVRQKVEWQKQCSVMLNEHRVLDGLRPYQEQGHMHWFETQVNAHGQLVKDYVAHMRTYSYESRMALAYRNTEVYELNQLIRSELKAQGHLKEHFQVNGSEYSIGDVIRFTQNDHHGKFVKSTNFWSEYNKGVKNGTIGTIISFDTRRQELKVSLEGERIVKFKAEEYKDFTLGYAMGVHKSEGSTFHRTFVSPDSLMDPSTTLVAMSRHRFDLQIYVNHEQFVDFKDLVDQLSYGAVRETLADYQVSDAQKPFLARVQDYKDLIAEVGTLREEMEWASHRVKIKDVAKDNDTEKKPEPLYKQDAYSAYQQLFEQKEEAAREILADWDNHVPYVRLAGIRRDVLEVDAGLRNRLLSDLEHRASISAQGYMSMVRQTRTLWSKIEATHPGSLSQTHELFKDYAELKSKRDFMASVIHENPRLYRQFFSVKQEENSETHNDYWGEKVTPEEMVYFAGVKDQAKAHYKGHARNTYYEGLNDLQKQDFKLVESYVQMRNQTATIYGQLKKLEENAFQFSFNTRITQDEFKRTQSCRDELALQLLSTGGQLQPHFDQLKIDENKLIEHAICGQTRGLIRDYKEVPDTQNRADVANKLLFQRNHDKSKPIMKEADIDFNRLSFDVAFNKGVMSGEISAGIQPDEAYQPIKDYLSKSHEAARLWSLVQAKGKESGLELEPMGIMSQSSLKPEWLTLLKARNQSADALVQNQDALVAFKGMRPEAEPKLLAQAEKARPRSYGYENDIRTQETNPAHELASNHLAPSFRVQREAYSPNYISADDVLEAAKGRYADIVPRLLGLPSTKQSNKTQLRFGGDGKLSFTLAGDKAGLWYDFSTGEKGNIFHLIQREKGVDFRGAVEYLAKELIVNAYDLSQRPVDKRPEEPTIDKSEEDAQKLQAVAELYARAQSIKGTAVETYLRKERGIKGPLSEDLKFLSKDITFLYNGQPRIIGHDCFAAFGRKADGSLSVVQVTRILDDGTRAKYPDGSKINKIQYGLSKDSFVTLQQGSGRVFIAEGLETAMSIKETGVTGKIVASLGIHNMANYNGSERTIVLCADNDEHKPTSQTNLLVHKSMDALEDKGYNVDVIKPSTPGQDFNDVLKEQGKQGVVEYVKPYLKVTFKTSLTRTEITKEASCFEGLLKRIDATKELDVMERTDLRYQIRDRMEALNKTLGPTIADIKAVNEPVGAKLEEMFRRELQREQSRDTGRGMEM